MVHLPAPAARLRADPVLLALEVPVAVVVSAVVAASAPVKVLQVKARPSRSPARK